MKYVSALRWYLLDVCVYLDIYTAICETHNQSNNWCMMYEQSVSSVHVCLKLLWLWLNLPPFNFRYQLLLVRVYSDMMLPNDTEEAIDSVRHGPIGLDLIQLLVDALSSLLTHEPQAYTTFLDPIWYMRFQHVHLW